MTTSKELVAHIKMLESAIPDPTQAPHVATVTRETLVLIRKMIVAQDEELTQLRAIFDDMVGMNDVLHAARMQERNRCLRLVADLPGHGGDWLNALVNAIWEGKNEL